MFLKDQASIIFLISKIIHRYRASVFRLRVHHWLLDKLRSNRTRSQSGDRIYQVWTGEELDTSSGWGVRECGQAGERSREHYQSGTVLSLEDWTLLLLLYSLSSLNRCRFQGTPLKGWTKELRSHFVSRTNLKKSNPANLCPRSRATLLQEVPRRTHRQAAEEALPPPLPRPPCKQRRLTGCSQERGRQCRVTVSAGPGSGRV